MRVYDRERTICDVIRHSSKMEQEVVAKAIQAYFRDRLRNVIHLMAIGAMTGVQPSYTSAFGQPTNTNYRMDEMSAALGWAQMQRIDERSPT